MGKGDKDDKGGSDKIPKELLRLYKRYKEALKQTSKALGLSFSELELVASLDEETKSVSHDFDRGKSVKSGQKNIAGGDRHNKGQSKGVTTRFEKAKEKLKDPRYAEKMQERLKTFHRWKEEEESAQNRDDPGHGSKPPSFKSSDQANQHKTSGEQLAQFLKWRKYDAGAVDEICRREGLVNVPGDGFCFYHAVIEQLIRKKGGTHWTAETLHAAAVKMIIANWKRYALKLHQLNTAPGTPPPSNNDLIRAISKYLVGQTNPSVNPWADGLMAQVVSDILNMQIQVTMLGQQGQLLTAWGPSGIVTVNPQSGQPIGAIGVVNFNNVHFMAHSAVPNWGQGDTVYEDDRDQDLEDGGNLSGSIGSDGEDDESGGDGGHISEDEVGDDESVNAALDGPWEAPFAAPAVGMDEPLPDPIIAAASHALEAALADQAELNSAVVPPAAAAAAAAAEQQVMAQIAVAEALTAVVLAMSSTPTAPALALEPTAHHSVTVVAQNTSAVPAGEAALSPVDGEAVVSGSSSTHSLGDTVGLGGL